MSVIAEVSIFPMDKGISVSPYVTRAVDIIKKSGLDYVLGPMGTSIEGQWQEVIHVIDLCFQDLKTDCDRVYLTLKIDYRKGEGKPLQTKVESVKKS